MNCIKWYLICLQLAYAAIVSTIYSLLMMVVLVGLLVEAAGAGLCSVTTLFLLFVAGVFVLSAILHPQVATKIDPLFDRLYWGPQIYFYILIKYYYRRGGAVGYIVHLACGRFGVRISAATDRSTDRPNAWQQVWMSHVLGDDHYKCPLSQ